MRKEYNFSKSVKNPYAEKLKKQITIRVDEETIEYFKSLPHRNKYSLSKTYEHLSCRMCKKQ
jgi:hypothetical protein